VQAWQKRAVGAFISVIGMRRSLPDGYPAAPRRPLIAIKAGGATLLHQWG